MCKYVSKYIRSDVIFIPLHTKHMKLLSKITLLQLLLCMCEFVASVQPQYLLARHKNAMVLRDFSVTLSAPVLLAFLVLAFTQGNRL